MTHFDEYPPRSRNRGVPMLVLLAVAFSLAALLLEFRSWGGWGGLHQSDARPRVVEARGDLAADEKSTIDLFKNASPSVVYITTSVVQRDAFSLNVQEVPKGTGSGFIWDAANGYVVTNFHVVQGSAAARVTLADNSSYPSRVVGFSAEHDLAVLKINAPAGKLREIPIGTSHDLQVGQKAFAIGDPFGLDQSLTTGVVSALGREIQSVAQTPIRGVIQTNAAINPGNSGGPLLDSAGRLIGVNTAIYSPSGTFAGIGFAIPVDDVNRVVPQLIAGGRVSRPVLGVQIADDALARRFQLPGVLIRDVLPDGPAQRAGLRPTRRDADGELQLGDVITALDGIAVKTNGNLHDQLAKHKPGDKVKLTIVRDGREQTVDVTLDQAYSQ
jgi:S1-C subfamily serine protease